MSAAVSLGQPGTVFRYAGTLGVLETPYLSDTTHINRPMGLCMDDSDNLYITEEQGRRVLKYNSSGSAVLALGKAGVSYTDDYVFNYPMDVAVDGDGNIWVADDSRVVQYTPGGVISQSIPARDDEPWRWEDDGDPTDDNTRFSGVRGVAFDSAGRMFVADTYNYRIQVYTFTVEGSPVYSATIGEKDVAGSDNAHFDEPQRLAVDGSDRLYVVDRNNGRVQRCAFSGGSWTCATFDSGLNYPNGITIRGDNVYIADTYNGRIRRCSVASGVCSDFVTDTYGMYDVAVDSSGNVYGSAAWEAIVAEFDSSGNPQGAFLGVEGVPYLTDGYHYNHPRVAIDNSNNIIIVEENGQRLLKLNSSGVPQWAVGVPGVDTNSDNDHFNWPHGVATDNSGNIYVADGCRVQIFNSNGVHSATLGGPDCGNGTYEFDWATGIAVDNNGNIYVADGNNHRVQVYNSSRVFVTTIGATGQCGTANNRFCTPLGVDTDAAGNIYVADGGNCRVQKFNSSRVYQMTLGETGNCGDSFSQFDWSEDVAVDGQGRIYVADWGNQRVQVFDSNGAYLTTIGGEWGDHSSQFRGVSSVDLDSTGNVYVTDWENARLQKFASDVPDWEQVNINGFGNRRNEGVLSLAVFSDTLYAGTLNFDTGGEIWRMSSPWTAVITGGLGYAYNVGIDHLIEFKSNLYAGTWADETNGGEVWRSSNGLNWTRVVSQGFGDPTNGEVFRFAVFSDTLYASTDSYTDTHGAEIWRSSTGNAGDWTRVVADGFGDADNGFVPSLETFNGYLYVGAFNWDVAGQTSTGGEVWRSNTGDDGSWSQVNTGGFGDSDNIGVASFAVFNGYLYAGTQNGTTGGQVWRCSTGSGCDENSNWSQVVGDGFGDGNNFRADALIVSDNDLYCVTRNDETGVEVWRSSTGDSGGWEQVGPDGFGDSNNYRSYWDNAVVEGSLYIGTWNWANGGEVWQLAGGGQVYLPIILKSYRP